MRVTKYIREIVTYLASHPGECIETSEGEYTYECRLDYDEYDAHLPVYHGTRVGLGGAHNASLTTMLKLGVLVADPYDSPPVYRYVLADGLPDALQVVRTQAQMSITAGELANYRNWVKNREDSGLSGQPWDIGAFVDTAIVSAHPGRRVFIGDQKCAKCGHVSPRCVQAAATSDAMYPDVGTCSQCGKKASRFLKNSVQLVVGNVGQVDR